MDPGVAREIEAAVGEQLGHFGASGRVVFLGRQIELHGNGPAVSIDVDPIGEQWPLLPPDLRLRKAHDLARRLVEGQWAAGPLLEGPRGAPPLSFPPMSGPPITMDSAGEGGRRPASIAPPPAASPPAGPRLDERPYAAPAPALRPGPPRVARPGGPAKKTLVIPIGAVIVVALCALFTWRIFRAEPPAPAPVTAASITEPIEDPTRAARVCEAARKRVYSGASMGPLDTEGWVAELWVASRSTSPAEALSGLVAEGRLTAAADGELAAMGDGRAEIAPGFAAADEARFPGWRAATLRLSGGYMRAFVNPAQRARFLSLADRVAESSRAELGALYGRCAHLTFREAGAWFRGADAASAATALVYAVGTFAEQPAVNRRALEALGGPTPLDALRAAGEEAKLDAAGLATLIGAEGGSVTPGQGDAISLSFPLGGPIRATRASRIVARKLGVGDAAAPPAE